MRNTILLIIITLLPFSRISAQSRLVAKSTDVVALLPSATGLVKAFVERDREGFMQLCLSSATTVALNYGLEALVKKERPDASSFDAFPSSHTAVAFDGASFLLRRYGWKWGVPAYALSAYVAWGRVYVKRHDWWDVLGGAVLGAGSAFIYTRPFARKADISIAPATFGKESAGLSMRVEF